MYPVVIAFVIAIVIIIIVVITLVITLNNDPKENSSSLNLEGQGENVEDSQSKVVTPYSSLDVGTIIQIERDPEVKFLHSNEQGSKNVITISPENMTNQPVKDEDYIVSRGIHITDISRSACYEGAIGLYNMSVRKTSNGYSGTIRGSSCNGCCPQNNFPYYSYAYYISLLDDGSVKNLTLLDVGYGKFNQCTNDLGGFHANGIEDPRIFIFKDEEWIIGNSLGSPQQPYPCINAMCIFKVSDPKSTFKILTPPKGVSLDQRQKNWSPFEYNGELYCEYSIEPHVILKIDIATGLTEEKWRTGSSSQDITAETSLRGGAPPILVTIPTRKPSKQQNIDPLKSLPKLFYLGVGHIRVRSTSDYLHFFYAFEPKPPFRILKITPQFKLDGNERIQFAAGLSHDDEMVYISYGIDDCYNRISQFYISDILSIMK